MAVEVAAPLGRAGSSPAIPCRSTAASRCSRISPRRRSSPRSPHALGRRRRPDGGVLGRRVWRRGPAADRGGPGRPRVGAVVGGGTGLYLRAALAPLAVAPAGDPELRARLEERAAAERAPSVAARRAGTARSGGGRSHRPAERAAGGPGPGGGHRRRRTGVVGPGRPLGARPTTTRRWWWAWPWTATELYGPHRARGRPRWSGREPWRRCGASGKSAGQRGDCGRAGRGIEQRHRLSGDLPLPGRASRPGRRR